MIENAMDPSPEAMHAQPEMTPMTSQHMPGPMPVSNWTSQMRSSNHMNGHKFAHRRTPSDQPESAQMMPQSVAPTTHAMHPMNGGAGSYGADSDGYHEKSSMMQPSNSYNQQQSQPMENVNYIGAGNNQVVQGPQAGNFHPGQSSQQAARSRSSHEHDMNLVNMGQALASSNLHKTTGETVNMHPNTNQIHPGRLTTLHHAMNSIEQRENLNPGFITPKSAGAFNPMAAMSMHVNSNLKPSRGKYRCGRCGQVKTNHMCPFMADTEMRSMYTQTDPLLSGTPPNQGNAQHEDMEEEETFPGYTSSERTVTVRHQVDALKVN